jgi:hypothetical protein
MADFYKGYFDDHCFAHHGILGQKWGIRRYQNADGTLTAAGKARMNEVSNSKIRSKLDTSAARRVYKQNARYASSAAIANSRKSVKLQKKAEKYAEGTEENKRLLKESKEAAERSNKFSKMSDAATKKIQDIDEGKIKAGRDFIVQRDLDIDITHLPMYIETAKEAMEPILGQTTTPNPWLGRNEYRVIEKQKSSGNDSMESVYKKYAKEYLNVTTNYETDPVLRKRQIDRKKFIEKEVQDAVKASGAKDPDYETRKILKDFKNS